jgi:hypothetical protein
MIVMRSASRLLLVEWSALTRRRPYTAAAGKEEATMQGGGA